MSAPEAGKRVDEETTGPEVVDRKEDGEDTASPSQANVKEADEETFPAQTVDSEETAADETNSEIVSATRIDTKHNQEIFLT